MKPLYRNLGVVLISLVILWFLGKFIMPFLLPLLGKVLAVLLPFIIAVFFSMLMEPLIVLLHDKLRFNRTLAVITSMLLVFGSITLIIAIIIVRLIVELVDLARFLPAYQESFDTLGRQLMEQGKYYYQIGASYGENSHLAELIQNNLGPLTNTIQNWVSNTLHYLINFATLIPGGITTLVTVSLVVLISTFFISKDRHYITQIWLKYAPKPMGARALKVMTEIFTAFSGYLRAQLILISLTMVQSIIGLYLIGAKYALIMGLVIGIFDLIPVLGPSAVFLPWIIYSFLVGSTGFAIKLTVLWLVILSVRQVMETKVVADSLGLHPLATLLAMYAGLKFFGVLGMIGGPILIIAVQAYLKTFNVRT